MPAESTRFILTALAVIALLLDGASAHAVEFDIVVRNGQVMNPADC